MLWISLNERTWLCSNFREYYMCIYRYSTSHISLKTSVWESYSDILFPMLNKLNTTCITCSDFHTSHSPLAFSMISTISSLFIFSKKAINMSTESEVLPLVIIQSVNNARLGLRSSKNSSIRDSLWPVTICQKSSLVFQNQEVYRTYHR